MFLTIEYLGEQIRLHREHKGYSQKQLAEKLSDKGINRSNIAHLEQGRKLPAEMDKIRYICNLLEIPEPIWQPFFSLKTRKRAEFEAVLAELIGESVISLNVDTTSLVVVEDKIIELFSKKHPEHSFEIFNSIIVFYGVKTISREFFDKYLYLHFSSVDKFRESVHIFIRDAIRLFSSIQEAYQRMNESGKLNEILVPLEHTKLDSYTLRSHWFAGDSIPNKDLPYLGYIAASQVKKETAERKELSQFLINLAENKASGSMDLNSIHIKTKNKMEGLLRKFDSRIKHGLFSPLFNPDADLLKSEAEYISPKDESDIERMEKIQTQAYKNLGNYLTSDFMDVYVATSMRTEADFISVNEFVESLFKHEDLEELKLRYFNPTQSWIEDRIAKGLVEALMLKRASICIYMAQKTDTFGKDSEASVTLGQGKPVVVYVPRLFYEKLSLDSEHIGQLKRDELLEKLKLLNPKLLKDIDESTDEIGLFAKIINEILLRASDEELTEITKNHWADFDLFGEAGERLASTESLLLKFKDWLRKIINGEKIEIDQQIRDKLIDILVANSINYEIRAKVFREIHPLALQVILSTGVLNGILVVRSLQDCAYIIRNLIENKLELELIIDDINYKLVEKRTKSTIRVISKHKLLANTFSTFYKTRIT